MRQTRAWFLMPALLALGSAVIAPDPAAAVGSLAVTVTADGHDASPGDGVCETAAGNGHCSLRAAVEEANASPGTQAIPLPAGHYILSINDPLEFTDDVLIQGAGARRSFIQREPSARRLNVLVMGTALADLRYLTVKDGSTGILNYGDLFLLGVTIERNTGDGGILNEGSATIISSTIQNNDARESSQALVGGGITNGTSYDDTRSDTELILSNVTISGNTTNKNGGGIFFENKTTGFLNNVTIADNVAGIEQSPTSQFNGGGIDIAPAGIDYEPATVEMKNTILIGNVDTSASPDNSPDCFNRGVIVSHGHNLIGKRNECPFTRDDTDLTGTVAVPIPRGNVLEPTLRNNGGQTLTLALVPGSPAIDTASRAARPGVVGRCAYEDQRSQTRPVDGDGDGTAICDMGAFEFIRFPRMMAAGASMKEGDTGKRSMSFTVSLSKKSLQKVSVKFTTGDGTATAGKDFVAKAGTLVIPAGEVAATITVDVLGDTKPDGTERFTVNLSDPDHARLATKTVTGTIKGDD